MQWYKVTKTINGRKYLYWQKTYRVGRTVKTLNKYIGPATATFAGHGVPMPTFVEQIRERFPSTISGERMMAKERRADEKIQYGGSPKDRVKRHNAKVRAAKKLTRHLNPLNYFAGKIALDRK